MTFKQLAFDLPVRPALGRDDFFVSPANGVALAAVEGWHDWSGGKLVLYGPPGAGKTHLCHVWADLSGAAVISASGLAGREISDLIAKRVVAVEDIDRAGGHAADEAALFHLHNLLLAEGGRLLMTGTGTPAAWPLGLADLKSRIQGTAAAILEPPDDALLAALMMKLFADRQLTVQPNVLAYLLRRIDRSFADVQRVVGLLDRQALAEGRAVTRALAGKLLDNQEHRRA